MSKRMSKHSLVIIGGGVVFIVLSAIIIFAYGWYQSWRDGENYKKGHQAYLQADCTTSMQYFEKVLNGTEEYAQTARREYEVCMAFQAFF